MNVDELCPARWPRAACWGVVPSAPHTLVLFLLCSSRVLHTSRPDHVTQASLPFPPCAMANKLASLALLLVVYSASASAFSGGADHLGDLGFLSSGRRECRGTVAECLALEEGLGSADAEGHRRSLYGRRYIGYDALRKDNVPCSRRGASYYNCRPGGQANPYRRGCSCITRCRS
jgi:hypothetical protein